MRWPCAYSDPILTICCNSGIYLSLKKQVSIVFKAGALALPFYFKEGSGRPTTNTCNMSLKNTRLVQILAETTPSDVKRNHHEFVDRIGDIANLHDTISLRTAHEAFRAAEFGTGNIPVETVKNLKEDFIKTRAFLVHSTAASFIPKSRGTANSFPTPERVYSQLDKNNPDGPLHSKIFNPFRKFYTARQNDIESEVRRFRFHCNTLFSGISNELSCLAELDKSFSNMFSKYSRNCFDAVPELLESRFRVLFDQHQQTPPEKITIDDLEKWMGPNGWIFDFCKKMREMLFAELETRLLPLQGLIESLPCDYRGK
jgi:hypothetical protein